MYGFSYRNTITDSAKLEKFFQANEHASLEIALGQDDVDYHFSNDNETILNLYDLLI